MKIKPITIFGDLVISRLEFKRYQNGRLAIECHGEEGHIGTLTTNLPEVTLAPNEVIIKNWSENQEMAMKFRSAGHFIPTGKTVPTGFVNAIIATLSPELAAEAKASL